MKAKRFRCPFCGNAYAAKYRKAHLELHVKKWREPTPPPRRPAA